VSSGRNIRQTSAVRCHMEKSGINYKKGCGIGCLVIVVLGLVVIGGTTVGLNCHYGKAFEKRLLLEATYGDRQNYNPGPGPVVPQDTMERFLSVRRSLRGMCEKFTGNNDQMRGLERFDGVENVPKTEILNQGLRTTMSIFGAAKGLGDFAIARNEALLEQEMGFAEYTWIYVMTFYAGLGKSPVLGMGENRPGLLSSATSEAVLAMMARRAEAVEGTAEAEIWRREIQIMEADPGRPPFANGAPAFLRDLVEPFRSELEPLWCKDTDALELLKIKEHGAGYEDG
jgi:hypothetical protein